MDGAVGHFAHDMGSLTLQSTDNNDSLRIERREFEPLVNYHVTASFLGEQVTNEDVVFIGTTAFLRSLAELETSRVGSAVLNSATGCKLMFQANGQMGRVWLTFQVERQLYTFNSEAWLNRYGRIELSGGFHVSAESIGQLVDAFTELFQHGARTG